MKKNIEQAANSSERLDFMVHSVVCYEMSKRELYSASKLDVTERTRQKSFYTKKQAREKILKALEKKNWNVNYIKEVVSKTTDLSDYVRKTKLPQTKKFNALSKVVNAELNEKFRSKAHEISKIAANIWDVKYIDLFVKNRKEEIVYARFFMFWFLFNEGVSLSDIGRFYLKDHATVLAGLKRHDNNLSFNPNHLDYKEKFERFRVKLKKLGYV